MKYSFIAQQKKTWPIDLMCRALGVKRNGYYRLQKRRRNKSEDLAHQALLQCVKDIDVASDHSYGSRRMPWHFNVRAVQESLLIHFLLMIKVLTLHLLNIFLFPTFYFHMAFQSFSLQFSILF
jgi:hypothetical protein